MKPWSSVPGLEGLVVEAAEWLPSGSDAGLVRVRGRWTDLQRRQAELPALGLRRAEESRRFESLPDARFGRDPALWRATYLVPAALMDPAPDELWLAWESGARAGLPAPARGFQPPATPVPPAPPEPGGEVIDRAVLAERRARRAEAAERSQAQRAAEALKAVEVLELRSAELERRLEALQAAAQAEDPSPALPTLRAPLRPAPAPAGEAAPDRMPSAPAAPAAALSAAVAAVKRLRIELDEQRQRLRRSEILRAADSVALASFREAQGKVWRLEQLLAASEAQLADATAAAGARAAEARAAREQAAEQVALAQRRAAADAAAVRAKSAGELAAERERAVAAQAAAAEARTELEVAGRDLAAERRAHAGACERLGAREHELASIAAELSSVREALERVRQDAAGRAADLERRLAELDAALAEERRIHASTATEFEIARAGLAVAEATNRAESVARAALDEELDRERLARATINEVLDAARAETTAARDAAASAEAQGVAAGEAAASAEAQLARMREMAASKEAELAAAREAAASAEASFAARRESDRAELAAALETARSLRAELAAARSAGATAEAAARAEAVEARAAARELNALHERGQGALAAAERDLAGARARVAELQAALVRDRGVSASKEQVTGPPFARVKEVARADDDDLVRRAEDQAAASTAAARPADNQRREVAANLDAAAAALRARVAPEPRPDAAVKAGELPEAASSPTAARISAAPPPRPRILTEAGHLARADVVGTSARVYPWLRGALVKLAHDDPRAATRLLLGLVPIQSALVQSPLDYDLTIKGWGTYAVRVGEDGAAARTVPVPRLREHAAFHVSADIVTLAELLAGVEKHMGRWLGPLRVRGRRRSATALWAALANAQLDLPAAARAGADLDPDLVFRTLAYAIHPAWTKGHTFTIVQEITDPTPLRWHVAVHDGAPVSVERRAPATPPDAVVSMTRAAFSHMLRGEPAPSGERPAIRGDVAVVATLKAWTDRAQGRAA